MSFYGSRQGGELSGPWLVAALGAIGVRSSSVRQTLWRMERDGELEARRRGRAKLYRLTPLARAEMEIGADKILNPPEPGWDGRWTLVVYAFESEDRPDRLRLKAALDAEGFAPLAPGIAIHPRDRGGRIRTAADEQGFGGRIEVFRADRFAPGDGSRFTQDLWDLPTVARRYRAFLHDFGPLLVTDVPDPATAFAVRFAVVLRYLRAAWPDPELPPALLPPDWPGSEARRVAAALYRRLLPGALAFGDAIA
ncbi:MAG TPA: PaaX family transcriptional regulator C-terminal domain-containing protein [Gemmatimonadota bacterium]|nr:PaaX family transcriptional regulator C-terminal domain-containing protein [Gemmatimonadota bacterium]